MTNRVTIFLLFWLALVATVWVGHEIWRSALWVADEPRPVTARGTLAESETSAVELFERVSPSVVFVAAKFPQDGLPSDPSSRTGAGSGFVWDRAGHIVTNHHVVGNADRVAVRMGDSSLIDVEVVGTAPDYDLAVLRMPDPRAGLRPIAVGTSKDLRVGQSAFGLGNPFGLTRTLTKGIVSALDRNLPTRTARQIEGVIQTDAAINPGNSGGPLLDSGGRLIGVNTAIVSGTGASVGIGFAIPVDTINRVVPQLIETGRMPRPGIGIEVLPQYLAARVDVRGVIVANVMPGSPAEDAGLTGIDRRRGRLGDIITEVGDEPVRSIAELSNALGEVEIGNTAVVTLTRGGDERQVEVEVIDISRT